MRSKSNKTNGYIVYAVSGTNTISFGIDPRSADLSGLLGFAVERIDQKKGERKFLDGYKVFKELIPNPSPDTVANTYSQPIQSFLWDDFTCSEDTAYEYLFYPLKGTPEHIDRTAKPIPVNIKTEPLFSEHESDVFFNRGAASSQAYRRKFYNLPPDKITDKDMLSKALDWLSRDLDDAILKFIGQAKKGDTLLGCFYEFHYGPVLDAFKAALDKGVLVRLIIDAKDNSYTDTKGKLHAAFPKEANLRALELAEIPVDAASGIIYQRTARKDAIQHNKFIVFQPKGYTEPTQVWTGSTNISNGGIHGQTNVGHWIRNEKTAIKYKAYWDLLSTDPGGHETDDSATAKTKNGNLKKSVEALQANIRFTGWEDIAAGITPVFSPRTGPAILDSYVGMFDSAKDMACITLAFGINKAFKNATANNTYQSAISFLLLEKEDKPSEKSKTEFVFIGAKQNVYKAWGNYLHDNLYQWAKETSTIQMGLNTHVAYIHSKFLLVDPLSADPVVVTGSANFSAASTNDNDENMVIIRGDRRVADIYYTEFNRLFNHYYFRSVYNNLKAKKSADAGPSIFLQPDDSWTGKYVQGKLGYKRVDALSKMYIG